MISKGNRGYFSATQALDKDVPINLYRFKDGSIKKVTTVGRHPPNFEDAEDLGEVVEWKKKIK